MRCCWIVLVVVGAALGAPGSLVSNGDFARQGEDWGLPDDGALVVAAQAGPYTNAVRATVTPSEQPWTRALRQGLGVSVAQGNRLELRFWGRSAEGCRVTAKVEQASDPWTASLSETVRLTADWREYTFTGPAAASYRADGWALAFHLAHDRGVVELAGVRLVNLDDQSAPAGPEPTPQQPLLLLANGTFAQGLETWTGLGGAALQGELFDATLPSGPARAVKLRTAPPAGGQPWSVGFGTNSVGAVRRGDAIYFRAWLRSPDRTPVTFIAELNGPPHTKDISQAATPGPQWQEFRFVGRAARAYQPGELTLKWFLGHRAGTVEIAAVRADNCGAAPGYDFRETIDYWGGRPHDDTWRAAALERIEQLRKGDLTVRVQDANGQPLRGAQVQVQQLTHHFRFGTAAPAARFVDTANPDNAKFRDAVKELFNTVTFENDLKWAGLSDAGLERATQAAAWLRANGLEVRGHCLVWGSYEHLPAALRNLRGAALRAAIEAHVRDYAKRFQGTVYLWDVVNEAGSNTEVWDSTGWDLFPQVFKIAREVDPTVRLAYNDYSMTVESNTYRDKVAARVKQLIDGGAPFDTIGLQEHHGTPLTPLPTILKWLDYWATFGKDLEITEYDVGVRDDAVHAAWSKDHLIACFSHPKVTAYIMWGFWDGSHWRGKEGGAMIRRDWTRRQACLDWQDLVWRQWWTNTTLPAPAGEAKLRAFYGRHRVTVTAPGVTAEATVDLRPGQAGEVVVKVR
ncbi:MAG: endo-1,4-beta-xylanase [Fimbriimonadaceae bacterium]|nr:endo-1,4-beta-xylanase [Fimbriimonadaceae bacterium]